MPSARVVPDRLRERPVRRGTVRLSRASPERARPGKNEARFDPVRSSRFRLVFRHAGERFYTGIYGLKPIYQDSKASNPPPSPLRFTADKFITADDVLVSVIRVHNPTDRVQTIRVAPIIEPRTTLGTGHRRRLRG